MSFVIKEYKVENLVYFKEKIEKKSLQVVFHL